MWRFYQRVFIKWKNTFKMFSKITVNLQLELWNQNVFLQINFSLTCWTPTKFEAKVLSKMHVILWGLMLGLARGFHTCEWCKHSRWEAASPIRGYYIGFNLAKHSTPVLTHYLEDSSPAMGRYPVLWLWSMAALLKYIQNTNVFRWKMSYF